jgi:hypothetical protein
MYIQFVDNKSTQHVCFLECPAETTSLKIQNAFAYAGIRIQETAIRKIVMPGSAPSQDENVIFVVTLTKSQYTDMIHRAFTGSSFSALTGILQ